MALSFFGKILKCLLFMATFIIFLGGIAVLAVGIYAYVNKVEAVEQLLGSEAYTYGAFILMASGGVIALISLLGCCGAYKEEKFQLALYFLVLAIIFIILLVGGALGFIFQDKVETQLHDKMYLTVDQYGDHGKEYITNAWNIIQMMFECCGLSNDTGGYIIWEDNEFLKNNSLTVPPTCCKDMEGGMELCQMDPKNNVFEKGCYEVARNYVKKNSKLLGAIGLGIAFALVVGMALTCGVYQRLPKR